MSKTSIEWTQGDDGSPGVTWNPTRGCTRVSEGCRNCYAERFAARMPWGEAFAQMTPAGPRWTGVVRLIPEKLTDPLHWRKPRRVFVNSTSDLFHEALPDMDIAQAFAVMVAARQHTYQILTKRPHRMRAWIEWARRERHFVGRWPLPNVWLGVSVEDQATADVRISILMETPAAKRFVSYEPALGPVDFDGDAHDGPGWLRGYHAEPVHACGGDEEACRTRCPEPEQTQNERLDWIIVGGESGPGARPFDLAWARETIRQCRASGVAVFFKQAGARPRDTDRCESCLDKSICWCVDSIVELRDSKGGDPSEWPVDLRVREFPGKGGPCPAVP